jgi:hypothetical protein
MAKNANSPAACSGRRAQRPHPLHTARSIEVSEQELRRIAACSSSHVGAVGVAQMELKPRKSAESQLAAAIGSGNVLRVRDQSESQLGY